jgi:predicted metal-dependent hydrolase
MLGFLKFKSAALIPRGNSRGLAKHREDARRIVHEKIAKWNQHYNLPIRKVFIKNQRTRWGSCSSKGNLNFSYRIVYLPEALQDYLIVHELCHLKEFNHGKGFWDLVSETIPNCRHLRLELKKY